MRNVWLTAPLQSVLTCDTSIYPSYSSWPERSLFVESNTYLPVALNADGVVIHLYQEEVLRVCAEQQRERRIAADVSGQEQWTRTWQLIQVTVKRHYKLICHQQSLVFGEIRREKTEFIEPSCGVTHAMLAGLVDSLFYRVTKSKI